MSVVYHALHGFTDTTGQNDHSINVCEGAIHAGF
jgi:hypothetical protein